MDMSLLWAAITLVLLILLLMLRIHWLEKDVEKLKAQGNFSDANRRCIIELNEKVNKLEVELKSRVNKFEAEQKQDLDCMGLQHEALETAEQETQKACEMDKTEQQAEG